MRVLLSMLLVSSAIIAAPAEAARILIITDPMTLERRMVVIEQPGPDRIYLCTMSPATSGCRDVTPRSR